MCGICGIYGIEDHQTIKRMSDAIAHRGPDDEGFFLDKGISLGHRRLSIIDLQGGRQPVHNEDESIWVVFNGEIYNYQEIRESLKNHVFYTNSDTEVLVHCYEEYGDNFVEKLNGMFAFAIWDARQKKLLLARDPIGKKPLYYCHEGPIFYFASEIKALLEAGVKKELDISGLYSYLAYEYSIGNGTLFKGIKKLPGGHILTIKDGTVNIKKYWDISEGFLTDNEDVIATKLRSLLEKSARYRMIADVPIGAFLSGGLDSSSVVALTRPLANYDFHTFAVGFETFSELEYAKVVSDHLDTVHHEIIIDGKMVSDCIRKIAWHYDEPMGDSAIVNNYMLSREARKYVKVVVAGEAGDEIFAGYDNYGRNLAINSLLKTPVLGSAMRGLAKSFGGSTVFYNDGSFLRGMGKGMNLASQPTLARLHQNSTRPLNDAEIMYWTTLKREDVDARAVPTQAMQRPLNEMLALDCKNLLPEKYLMKADKAIMANSVEQRLPLMDKNIIEFAFSIPPELKLKGNNEKYILKKAVKDLLPDAILKRKKQGFNTQVDAWMAYGELKELTAHTLDESPIIKEYFRKEKITRIVNGLKSNNINGRMTWRLMALGLWYDTYFNS